jgi:hypothetical protein
MASNASKDITFFTKVRSVYTELSFIHDNGGGWSSVAN